MKVYLAGKITGTTWRNYLVLPESYSVVGPTWVNLAHDDISVGRHTMHGGPLEGEHDPNHGFLRDHVAVLNRCMNQIQSCDVFFAWITSGDCFGTLAEIGVAYRANKIILIGFMDGEWSDWEELWFVWTMASEVGKFESPQKAWDNLAIGAERQFLRRLPYDEYLQTEHWQRVRLDAIRRASGRCQLCFSADQLQVHHRTYIRRGDEEPMDLTVLCAECHTRHHAVLNGKRAAAVPARP